jgi:hypothetical protein
MSGHAGQPSLEGFLQLSQDLTAYSIFELRGTGQADAYLRAVVDVVGREVLGDLLNTHAAIDAADPAQREAQIRRQILGDPRLGPIARNIIKLWFVGVWYQLPPAWSKTYGAREGDQTFSVSAAAYTEGLLWKTIGANPPGAKSPGYGSWADPPRIPEPGKRNQFLQLRTGR